MKVIRKAELLAVGDELLNGLRDNSHLPYLGEQLERLGIGLHWASECRDDPGDIQEAVLKAMDRANLIIVTGGLGPTRDDFTAACVATAVERPLQHNLEVENAIREYFQSRNRTPTENNWKQCEVVQGAVVLKNDNGTAPGQWIELEDCIIVLLPGPPRELKPMFEEEVVPRLQDGGWVLEQVAPVEIRTMGIGESQVADMLEPIFSNAGERIRVAYCAHLSYVDVRILATDESVSRVFLRSIGDSCRERLGQAFLGFGQPDVACLILKHLRCLNKSLAVAESCTGGLLASRFTDIAGASKVFKGGVVCYNNEVKESILGIPDCLIGQHGAVSSECAAAMATAVAEIMESDYGLAITGYAGPEAGKEPAGTVYLGYHSPVGVWSRRVVLPGNRTAVKERAVFASLDFIRRKLDKYQMYDLLESLRC